MQTYYKHFAYLIFILSIVFVNCKSEPTTPESKTKPNIVFILADDLGYNDLSCYGSKYYETPNIDRIASTGTLFANGYAACQVCSPSRASIMTGKFPARHGITDWIGAAHGEDWRRAKRYTKMLPPDYEHELDKADLTIAEALKANGYKTFFAGKWHLGNEGSYPTDHGFDINQGGYERGGPYSGGFFSPFDNPQMYDHPDELGMSLPEKLAKETNQFISSNKDEPFFAMLSFYAVHAPIQTNPEYWSYFRDKAEEQGINEDGFTMEQRLPYRLKQDNPVYAGLIKHMDDAVGQVLDQLDKLGLADNTIVVFTSDNGGVVSGDNYSTNLEPLRGGKGYQWEGGIKVPYLMRVPGLSKSPKTIEARVSSTDLFPTLIDYAGIDLLPEQHQDGTSLRTLFDGKNLRSRPLIWHYPHYGNQGGDPSSIVIVDDWKLIYYHETQAIELYDIKKDISEKSNIAAKYPDKANELKETLMSNLENMNARFPAEDPQFSQDSFDIKHQYFSVTVKERLEKQRKLMLSEDWQPNKDWWGSVVTKD